MSAPIDPELLLRENAWLRRLARSLAADPETADDLFQDTWVAALEHPPHTLRDDARAWLVSVARNLVRAGGRRRANESARERSVARGEALPSVSESVERVAAQRELVDAVLALEPLERDLVVLRYFEDLQPRAIAKQLGLSGPAVRSRLSRALAQLRERLDRRFEGGRAAWAALLVPASWREAQPATTAFPLPFLLAAFAAGGAAVVVTVRTLTPSSEPEASAAPLLAATEPAQAPIEPEPSAPQLLPAVQAGTAHRVASDRAPAVPPAALASSTWTIVAHFVDGNDAPLAGVRFAHSARGDDWSVESDDGGDVRIELPWPYTGHLAGAGQLWVEARGRALATRGWYVKAKGPGEQSLGEIRMLPGGTLVGRAVDGEGRPIGGASVTASGGYAPETATGLDEARALRTNVRWLGMNSPSLSAPDGRFELDGAPAQPVAVYARFTGLLGGFSSMVPLAAGQVVDVGDVVLDEPAPENLITGAVVDARGAPVPRASIQFSEEDPRNSDAVERTVVQDGRFELLVPRGRKYTLLISRDEKGENPLLLPDVPSGTLDLVARFEEERWLELVALDEQRRVVPIKALAVSDLNGLWLRATSEALPDGRQRLRLPSVPFWIQIVTPGWKDLSQGFFDPATVADTLEFPVQACAGMSGRVLADGAPVAGARVHGHPQWEHGHAGVSDDGFRARINPRPFASTETDAEGRFRLPGDSSGTVTLHAELEGWARAELGPLEFVDGVEQEGLDLALERGGTIEGRVLLAEGVEARGKVVGAGCGEAHVFTQELGPDGTYRFEHLRPGDYQVLDVDPEYIDRLQSGTYMFAFADPAHPVARSTSVRAGEVTRFDLDQRDRIPSRLTGELRLDGQGVTGWWCNLSTLGDGAYTALAGGRFDLRVPRPGPFSLSISGTAGPARVMMHQALELAPGDNSWRQDLPTGTLTLENVPAFVRTKWGEQEAPAYGLRWRDDPALTWNAELHEPPETGTSVLTIPLVPAGHVQVLGRPEGLRYGFLDETWPVVLELDLVAGSNETVALP